MSWNGSNRTESPTSREIEAHSSRFRFNFRAFLIGLIVVALGLIALFFWGQTPQKPNKIKASAGSVPKSSPQIPSPPAPQPPPAALPSSTQETAQVSAKPAPVKDPGVIYAIDPEEKAKQKDERVYKTGVEEQLMVLFTTDLGDAPPLALPTLSEHDLKLLPEILISKNEVKSTDSDDVREVKDAVEYAKSEYRKFIKEGGDPQEFLDFYRNELQLAYDQRMDAQREIHRFLKSETGGDPEAVRTFVKKVDSILESKGIKPTRHSPRLKHILGEED